MFKQVIALYGVPRSGTSWLGQILDSCPEVIFRFQPLFSYRFKNRITTETNTEEIQNFFEELYAENNDAFLNQTAKRDAGAYPVFKSKDDAPSILAYKEARYIYTIPLLLEKYQNIKILCIIRNPFDTLESWINAPLEYNPKWNIFDEWEFAAKKNEYRPENYYGFYKWKEFLKMCYDLQKKFPNNFKTIRYEDLESNAEHIVQELFKFANLAYTKQTANFLFDSQNKSVNDAYGVYRKKNSIRERKYCLPHEIKEKISHELRDFEPAKEFGYY